MKNSLTKLFVTVLSIVLLIGAVAGITVLANEAETAYDIKSINVIHDEKSIVLIAVDLPADEALTAAPDVKVSYTLDGEALDADFHSYQYIAKYGAYYPCYYTVGIAPVDIAEKVTAVAYKNGAAADEAKAKSISLAEYLYIRLYRDDVISATDGDDLDRRGMYLALLEYGSYAQNVFHNNKPEYKDDQRTLANELIYVTAQGATVNGAEGVLLDKSAAVTFAGAPAAPAEYKLAGWQVTTYDKDGNVVKTDLLDSATYTAASTAVIAPTYARAWEDYEDGKSSNSIDNIGQGGTASIVTEDGNKFYRVAKPEGKSAQEYIYTPNAGLTYTDSDCVVYEAKLRVDFDTSKQGSFFILYGRYNGFKKFSIQNEAAGSEELTISDWRDGAQTSLSGRIGVKVGEWFTIRVENYKDAADNTIARVYINGVYFGESTNTGTNMNGAIATFNYNNITISSNNNMFNCKLDIDDVYVGEGKMYGFDDIVNDFENSTVASTGGKVSHSNATVAIKNAGSSVEIAEENGNKYLAYHMSANGAWMEQVIVNTTSLAEKDADMYVFEADVRTNSNVLFNMFGTDSDGAAGKATQIYLWKESNGLIRMSYGQGNAAVYTTVNAGDWFRVRVECEGTATRVYVNGDLIVEGTQTNDASTVKTMKIYTMTGAKGDTLGFDNFKAGFVKK